MIKDLKKYMRCSAKWAKIGGVSIGLNVVFLTLLILI